MIALKILNPMTAFSGGAVRQFCSSVYAPVFLLADTDTQHSPEIILHNGLES